MLFLQNTERGKKRKIWFVSRVIWRESIPQIYTDLENELRLFILGSSPRYVCTLAILFALYNTVFFGQNSIGITWNKHIKSEDLNCVRIEMILDTILSSMTNKVEYFFSFYFRKGYLSMKIMLMSFLKRSWALHSNRHYPWRHH